MDGVIGTNGLEQSLKNKQKINLLIAEIAGTCVFSIGRKELFKNLQKFAFSIRQEYDVRMIEKHLRYIIFNGFDGNLSLDGYGMALIKWIKLHISELI